MSKLTGHKHRDDVDLAWVEAREKLTLVGRQILRRVLNEALTELDVQFNAALQRGEVLELEASRAELEGLLLSAAQKQLTR